MLEYRTSIVPDCFALGSRLRQEDKDEVLAATGDTPVRALYHGYIHSTECFTMLDSTGLLGMFGYRIIDPKLVASVWMLGTDSLMDHRWEFLRRSKVWIDYLNTKADLLYNTVDLRNTTHIRWLEWLGFRFVRVIPDHGHARIPFVEFVRVSNGHRTTKASVG